MHVRRGLLLSLYGLKYTGLFPWSFGESKLEITCTSSDFLISFIVFCGTKLLTVYCLYSVVTKKHRMEGFGYNKSAMVYEKIVLCICGISQDLSNTWAWIIRSRSLSLVRQVLHWDNVYLMKSVSQGDCTFMVFLIWSIFCCIAVLYTPISIFCFEGVQLFDWYLIFPYTIQLILSGLIMIFQTTLIQTIGQTLKAINFKIEKSSLQGSRFQKAEIKNLIGMRQLLINFCSRDISEMYGIWILPIMWHALFGLPCLLFFMLSAETRVLDMTLVCTLWSFPTFIATAVVFNEGVLKKQAGRTARIFSKISARGTGIEKLVDNFLLKNVKKEPILTAYGFFPLNKPTLFKICAAIFTYMVILVQFKEMENESKKVALLI